MEGPSTHLTCTVIYMPVYNHCVSHNTCTYDDINAHVLSTVSNQYIHVHVPKLLKIHLTEKCGRVFSLSCMRVSIHAY